MSEASDPDPRAGADGPGPATELEVDPSAFLPDAEPVDAARLSEDLDRVEAALAALDAKTYGIDPETGEPIADAVLAADPTQLS